MKVPAHQRVYRILRRSRCFCADHPLPQEIEIAAGDRYLGAIVSEERAPQCFLTERGAFFAQATEPRFVHYSDIAVDFPFEKKTDPNGALTVHTPGGSFPFLRGMAELWTAGRFFMRCAEDAKEGEPARPDNAG